MTAQPSHRPVNPCFSSGPCAKRPGWSLDNLKGAFLGRSHRAAEGKNRLNAVIEQHRKILNIPADYRVAIVAASDTGAVEMALWSLLGQRGVDVLGWEVFGLDWIKDITTQLKIADTRVMKAPFGSLPDLSAVDGARDIVFTWNGTTGGVRVPNGDWIPANREGLTICDATSAVFAYDLPWDKLDVVTWSWQKVLGGEAAHGMIVLSPRAVERLLTYTPDRPLPKIFRLVNNGKLIDGVFVGETINTPSMLAVEDCLDALTWAEGIGGLPAMIKRVEANYQTIKDWVAKTDWVDFLAADESYRSKTSVCLAITDPDFAAMDDDSRQAFVKSMTKLLEKDGIAYDTAGHRDAPAGLRIWCGATVEQSDVAALLPWLDWAYTQTKNKN
ncbi:phosphoserine transaminase [Micavibrio aeruginosavorus]|uniref:phosphoserine transaminase n=1 Tax=Micavibrio aeruginosavorus EPB TaxID=349215 RepID=M4VEK7_9BACT|nr:phosphoserine transaminase [Micavibrio aeruginosavorus]AGH96930.1 Phosphoserine aminotransferase [Micavibrio aeruginosavorus EPB]